MTKELIQNLRSVGRLWEDEAADLIEAQQKRIDELTAERNEFAGYAKDGTVIAAQQQMKLAAAQEQLVKLREALENCRLLAARHRKEEWATHILRFCESGGSVANPLRQDDSALHERLKAERERCAKVADEWQTAIHDPRYQCDCAAAIRAMEDQ